MDKSIQSIIKSFKDSEASTSVVFGLMVMIIAGTLLFNYFRSERPAQLSDQAEATESAQLANAQSLELPAEYTVQAGDNLWKIAEKYYESGYNWVDIAKANGMSNPSVVIAGAKINVPKVEKKTATVVKAAATITTDKIEGTAYTVVKGDTLWDVAVRAYGNGYAWTKIWEANKEKVANPGIIEVGQQLSIPR